MNILAVILLLMIVFAIAKIIQLEHFTKYFRKFISGEYADITKQLREAKTIDDLDNIPQLHLDIDKSYDNQMWTMPWDYNFRNMVVYSKTYRVRPNNVDETV